MKKKLAAIFLSLSFSNLFAKPSLDDLFVLTQYKSPPEKIVFYSTLFLDKPYQFEPLGEGPKGYFNQLPLYRFDCFDCETFMNTILSLSISHNKIEFEKNLQRLTYQHNDISFINRNHFAMADWWPNIKNLHIIQDITSTLVPRADLATTTIFINKKNWLTHLTIERIKIRPGENVAQRLLELHQLSNQATNKTISFIYIPVENLLQKNNLDRIPNASIIFFLKKNSFVTLHRLGTDIDIVHMGFVIWKQGKPFLRAASSYKHKVVDIDLRTYLKNYQQIKGVKVFALTK